MRRMYNCLLILSTILININVCFAQEKIDLKGVWDYSMNDTKVVLKRVGKDSVKEPYLKRWEFEDGGILIKYMVSSPEVSYADSGKYRYRKPSSLFNFETINWQLIRSDSILFTTNQIYKLKMIGKDTLELLSISENVIRISFKEDKSNITSEDSSKLSSWIKELNVVINENDFSFFLLANTKFKTLDKKGADNLIVNRLSTMKEFLMNFGFSEEIIEMEKGEYYENTSGYIFFVKGG